MQMTLEVRAAARGPFGCFYIIIMHFPRRSFQYAMALIEVYAKSKNTLAEGTPFCAAAPQRKIAGPPLQY